MMKSRPAIDQVRSEFSAQAGGMDAAPAFHAAFVLEWFVNMVRSARCERVLDLACGPGIVAEVVAPHVSEIIGVDLTPAMLRLAREKFMQANLANGRFEIAAAQALPFMQGGMDQVLTRLSIHHFSDPLQVLKEVRRILRPRGSLILADVISSDDPQQAALHNSLERLRDPTHGRMLTRAELVRAVESAGFHVLSAEAWHQERTFPEWARIVSDPGRTAPLQVIMQTLAEAGLSAGIDLRLEAGELKFTHTWLLVNAQAD